MNLPDPLHPAIVHFPIALVLAGALLAVVSVFRPGWVAPRFTAIILGLGALGAVAATWTGDEDEDRAENAGQKAEQVLEEHEEWGERSRNMALLGALAAVASAASQKCSARVFRSASMLTAVISLGASCCVIEAGHYGGQLVYQHGVGVSQGGPAMIGKADLQRNTRHRDDD